MNCLDFLLMQDKFSDFRIRLAILQYIPFDIPPEFFC